MNRSAITLGVFLGCAVLAGSVSASSVVNPEQQRRSDLVVQIVEKWGGHVEGAYSRSSEAWGEDMVPLLMKVPMDALQRAADARTFDGMNDALLAKAAPVPTMPRVGLLNSRVSGGNGSPVPKNGDNTEALGDPASDLVYVPVVPCRLIDTRVAGGQIGGNSSRSFEVAAATDYTAQGGAATNCNIGSVSGVASAVINFTVVGPTNAGFVTAHAFGSPLPLAATVNYATGEIRGNLSIVPLDADAAGNDITVFTFAPTQLVADVVGYFIAPQASALSCTSTFVTQNVAANDIFDIQIPACPATYAVTGAGCRTPGFNQANWAINGLFRSGSATGTYCSGQNITAGAITVEGTAQCCRVPGR